MRISDWSSDVCSSDLVPGIVALHASAFAGDHARRQAVAARSIATGEAVAGGEGETGTAMARGAAFAVGDARDAARCILGRQRGGAQCFGVGFAAVVEVEVGHRAAEQQLFGREAGIRGPGRLAGSEARRVGKEWVRTGRYRW